MKNLKLSLIMAIVASSSMMAQQSVSMVDHKFDKTSEESEKVVVTTVDLNKEDVKIPSVSIYPNPASDLVTLQGVTVDDKISITDSKGKNRIQIKAKAEVEIIPIDFLESGTYLISINGEKRRLIVE